MKFPHLLLLAANAALAAPVTFTADVAPIIHKRCSGCHRPGEAAPFSLLSYEDVSKRAQLVAAVTRSRYMPPWKAEPASYAYRDDRRLSDAELNTIQAWVKQGMPQGDPSKMPALPKFQDGWQLGTPDLVVRMPKGVPVPAEGPDIYRNIVIPLSLTEGKWVRAIELRPSARKVVHHVLYFAAPHEDAAKLEAEQSAATGPNAGMRFTRSGVPMGGMAVGAQPHLLPNGLALKLEKGSDLIFQYHFHPSGKAETEQSTVGLYFAAKPPEHRMSALQLPVAYGLFSGIDIPAGKKDFTVSDSYVLPVDVEVVSIGAHAHYLGKTMLMTATLPGGEKKTLLDIRDWDFAWQDRYFFQDYVSLPKGTQLDCTVTWDNSEQNSRNPSRPPAEVTWGEQSNDEMGAVGLQLFPKVESDYAILHKDYRAHLMKIAGRRLVQDPGLLNRIRARFGGQIPSPPGLGGESER